MGCRMCPRMCDADRRVSHGVCGVSDKLKIARAALHFWEEPCISGENGSGAVFFSGCALHCVYCQNSKISDGQAGLEVSVERLTEIFFELACKNANNINLITGDHYIPQIACAIKEARRRGFDKPFIFNCSGYESIDALKGLDGLIDVYLPDLKYMEPEPAAKYSHAEDYPGIAKKAIDEMVRQCPVCRFNEDGLIMGGVIVRHMLLPGHVMNSKKVLKYLYERYKNNIYISIMSQYTPIAGIEERYPELGRRVKKSEYDRLTDYAVKLGVENAYIQDMEVAKESFIPEFDNEGVAYCGDADKL
ncbi:MAG: 4Fe-4S cluster-binding domain-containing protein [Lachnospiraceae bacterium]|nr:4Fe-4S cluster-binding domain-containing protein [Lachnospiraceae bacterium]